MVVLGLLGLSMMLICSGCSKESPDTTDTGAQPSADAMARYGRPEGDRFGRTPLVATTPAPKPTGPLAPDTTCVTAECHAKFGTPRYVHGPVIANSCRSCHEPDAGGHQYPLTRQGNETCTFCHAVVSGTQPFEHEAIHTDNCTGCHDPHASDTKYLINAISLERLCARCHDMPVQRFGHEPFVAGQCMLCHEPHQADNPNLIRGGEGPKLCLNCHKPIQDAMAGAADIHEPAKTDCLKCHNAHTSDYPNQLKLAMTDTCFSCHETTAAHVRTSAVKHDVVTDGDACANCHDPHASDRPRLLGDREDHLCMTCHNKAVTLADGRTLPDMTPVLSRRFLHGPIRSGDCSACHDAHGAAETDLLRTRFPATFYARFNLGDYALCFQCHDQELVLLDRTTRLTDFRDGDVNLHYLHVNRSEKGRTCKTCHNVHGSDLPNHMADEVPFEGSNWAMPIRFQKFPNGGSCAPGCHEPKDYRRGPASTPELPAADRGAS